MRTLATVLLPVLCLGVLLTMGPATASGITWMSDPSEALSKAEEEGRLVLVDAWAPWCAPCFEMEKTTWKDPDVRAAVEPFVRLKINHDVQKLFVERYSIEHLPILLVLDPEGEEITRAYGMMSAAEVQEMARMLLDGYDGYAAAAADRKNPVAQARAAEFLIDVGGYPGAVTIVKKALRRAKKDAALSTRLRLLLGEGQLGEGQLRAACRTFEEILESTADQDEARARALAGLVRAERERGRDEEADAALQQLRAQFPEHAAAF